MLASTPDAAPPAHRTRRLAVAGFAVLSGALLLGACTSSNNSSTTTTTTTTTPGGATTTPSTGGPVPTGSTGSAPTGSTGTATTTPSGATGAAAIGSISHTLQSGETASYDATYTATENGTTSTIEFAAEPPSSFAFVSTESGKKSDFFSDGKTTDVCSQDSGSSAWTCESLPQAEEGVYQEASQIFTGKFWLTELNTLSGQAAAAAAGITITNTTMSEAGQSLQCVVAKGGSAAAGVEVCVTSGGILGYVKDAASGDSFALTDFSSSPSSSLFQPPAGATVETIPSVP